MCWYVAGVIRFLCVLSKVADPPHFTADPDPDPAFHCNAVPDPDPTPHQSDKDLRPLLEPPGLHFEPPGLRLRPATALF